MPLIALVALAFGAGHLAGLLSFPAWIGAPVACLVALLCWRHANLAAIAFAAIAAGLAWGGGAHAVRERDCRWWWRDGQRVTAVLSPKGTWAPGSVQRMRLAGPRGCRGTVTVVLPDRLSALAGIVVQGAWRRELQPGGRDWRRPARAGRIVARRVRLLPEAVCPPRPPDYLQRLRACFAIATDRRLTGLFGARRAPLAAALTTDADASLPREQRDRYTRAGLAHLLSISGFHVGLLAGALLMLLRAIRVPPDAARLCGTALVAAYVALIGAGAPALRSGLLIGVWWWARLRQRPPPASAVIACCALAVMVADPFALLEPGPWLSFAGVWGLVAAGRLWSRVVRETRGRDARARRRWFAPVAASVGACLATAPVTIAVFGSVTPAALIANIGAAPLAAFAIPGIALSLMTAALPGGMAVAAAIAAASGLALDLLEHVVVFAASVPGGTIEIGGWPAAGVSAIVAVYLLRAPGRAGPRLAHTALGARALIGAGVAVCGFVWINAPLARSSDADGRLALHFLAVGQGDATAIRTPRGRWILVDAGPRSGAMDAGARLVAPYLRRQGARRLDLVVASHGDADHLGGLPAVLRALPVSLVLEPGQALTSALYRRWLGEIARRGTRWRRARAGDRIVIDGVTVRVWHPDSTWMRRGEGSNENSVVLTVEYGAFRALLPGDAGLPMEHVRAAAIGDVSVLKVGHHGSRSATSDAWLAATRPEWCVVSVGAGNRYGHPHRDVVQALAAAGCRTWRTDRHGHVVVTTDGRTTSFSAGGEP